MKCPKCNFISFDYNDACPKCGKDLTQERDLMGLPSSKPRPLSLLAPLNAYSEIPGDTTRNAQLPLPKVTMDDVPEELLISLDDLSDDEPVPIQIESDSTQAEPEQKIDDEIILDLRPPNSEKAKSKKDESLDSEALEERMAELEIEPLEFDLELEEPDEKIS